ncbi:MAG: hypothetical protein MUC83_10215 [Pirellula sp.]|nr:hypothetical protein [Pirellula sp.]
MESPLVQAKFDAVTRDGHEFVVTVAIGDRQDLNTKSGEIDVVFYIEVEPLMERRTQCGTDSLTAMCFSIQLVRKALMTFVAHGGSLFCPGTRFPIDLQSPYFESIGGLIRPQYLQRLPAAKESRES